METYDAALIATDLAALNCPSDPNSEQTVSVGFGTSIIGVTGSTNYFGNAGRYGRSLNQYHGTDPSSFGGLSNSPFLVTGDGMFTSLNSAFGKVKFASVTDGTSNTILIGERGVFPRKGGLSQSGGWLTAFTGVPYSMGHTVLCLESPDEGIVPHYSFPVNSDGVGSRLDDDDMGGGLGNLSDNDENFFWSYHPGGAQFAKVDGSTDFLAYTVSLDVVRSLLTKSGSEVVTIP